MPAPFRAAVRIGAFVWLMLLTVAAVRAETPIPPPPAEWVTDTAGLLSPQTVTDLNVRLRAYERETGHQILVYIAPTTGGTPIEDWAVRAFERWQVGRKGIDDGLVLFIFTRDRTDRIEVGYGLEPQVPDVLAARILRNTIEPGLRAGQPDRAVADGVDQILALIGGESNPGSAPNRAPLGPIDLVALALLSLIFLIALVRSPWLAVYLLFNIFGGRGGGGFGGGGFSGGGGRSGGGGASGRW